MSFLGGIARQIGPYDPDTGQIAGPGETASRNWDATFPGESNNTGALNQLGNDVTHDNKEAAKQAKTAEDLRKAQLGIATDIEGQGFKGDLYNQFRTKRLTDLATDQSTTTKRMAHRALLGPGSEGLQAKNLANASLDLSEGKNKINSFADEQAAQIRASVLTQGLQQRQTQQYMYDTIYNSALADYQAKRASQDSFMKGAGMVIGAGIA